MNKVIILLFFNALFTGSASLAMGNPIGRANSLAVKLCVAAREGDLERVQKFISAGADINQRINHGQHTALMFASGNGHQEVCQLLIERNAQVNRISKLGFSPLMIAAGYGHKEICQLLVDAMLKPIKQNQAAAIALLGMKKFRRAACMSPIDNNVIVLIAHQLLDQVKQSLFLQINKILEPDKEFRQHFLVYAREQLKIDPKIN